MMPEDEEFLVVEEVSTTTDGNGEEVAVVSGEAVKGADAALAVAAEKGSNAILSLSEPRLQARSLSGSVFAAMLIDQRNGTLPNPFSLWRLPDQYAAMSRAGDAEAPNPAGVPPVSSADGPAGLRDAPPEEDALATSRELSRMEATISQLVLKLEQMLRSMRGLVGTLSRLYGGPQR